MDFPSLNDATVPSVAELMQLFPIPNAQSNVANALAKTQFLRAGDLDFSPQATGVDTNTGGYKNIDLNAAFKKSFWDGIAAMGSNTFNAPVVKNVIDFLGSGMYASANTANNFEDAFQEAKDGKPRAITDALMAPLTGTVQGIGAGLGNDNDKKTYSDVIKKGMDMSGVDSNNTAAKWIQGIGGFAGDVLLDPTTYIPGVGLGKALVQGTKEGATALKGVGKVNDAIASLGDQEVPTMLANEAERASQSPGSAFISGLVNSLKDTHSANVAAKATKAEVKAAKAGPAYSYDDAVGATNPVDDLLNANLGVDAKGNPIRLPDSGGVSTGGDIPVDKPDLAQEMDKIFSDGESTGEASAGAGGAIPARSGLSPEEQGAADANAQADADGLRTEVPKDWKPDSIPDSIKPDLVEQAISKIPAKDLKVAEPGELTHTDTGLYNAPLHGAMENVHNTTQFQEPVYNGSQVNEVRDMESADLNAPKEEAPKPAQSGEVKFNMGQFRKDFNSNKVLPQPNPAQMDKGIVPKWSDVDKATVKNAKTEQDISAVLKRVHPITVKKYYTTTTTLADKEAAKLSPQELRTEKLNGIKIAPEHHGLSAIQLSKLRQPTNKAAQMANHILMDMNAKQTKELAAKLGMKISDHPTVDERARLAAIFARSEPIYKKVQTAVKSASKKSKVKDLIDKLSTDANVTEKAGKIAGISVEASRAKRFTDAVEAHVALRQGHTLKIEHPSVKGQKRIEKAVQIPGEMMEDESSAIRNGIIRYQSGIDRPHETSKLKDRTYTADPKSGGAVNGGRWEAATLMEEHSQLIHSVQRLEAELQKAQGKGVRLTIASKIDYIIRQADAVEKDLKVMGVQPYAAYINTARKVIDKKSGKLVDYRDKVLLSYADTLRSMPLSLVRKHLIGNRLTEAIQPIAMHLAMEAFMRGMRANHSDEQLIADIQKVLSGDPSIFTRHVTSGSNDEGTLLNAITGAKKAVNPKTGKPSANAHGIRNFVDAIVKANPGMKRADAAKKYAEMTLDTAKALVKNKEDLYKNLSNRVLINQKMTSIDAGLTGAKIAENVAERIKAQAENPVGALDWFDNIQSQLGDALKAFRESGGTDEAYNATSDAIDALRDALIPITSQKAAGVARKGAANSTKKGISESERLANRNAINHEDAEEAAKDGAEANKRDAGDDEYSAMDLGPSEFATDFLRKNHQWESFFNTNFLLGNSKFGDFLKSGQHTIGASQLAYHQLFLRHLKEMGNLKETWRQLQLEARAWQIADKPFQGSTPEIQKMYAVVSRVFDVNNAKSILTSNGISIENFINMSERKGIRYRDMGIHKDALTDEIESANDLWKHVDVFGSKLNVPDDYKVLDYLSKSYSALMHINEQQAAASQFARQFGKIEHEDGYVRVSWDPKTPSRVHGNRYTSKSNLKAQNEEGFIDFLDKNLFYPKEAAEELVNIHRLMNEVRHLDQTTPTGKFFANVFDPLTNALKASQTTLRPGHWVTNMLGDAIRNTLAGVYHINRYYYNLKTMRAIGHDIKIYGDDPLAAFGRRQDIHNGEFGRGELGAETIPLVFKGKKVNYNITRLGRLMEQGTYLNPHGAGLYEDPLHETEPTWSLTRHLVNMTDFLTNNPKFNVNKYAAARDNLTRGAIAIDVAMKGNWKDEQEMKLAMNAAVRKWAPTSTDFTAAESKTMRRSIFYYTWLRGMTVRVADVATSKPGVALIGNKALYNLAVANGVDPISMGNPFPPNQQFPSYYYDNVLGPQMKAAGGSLWGFSPYSPFIDVMDQWLGNQTGAGVLNGQNAANLGKSLVNMSTPFARIPLEFSLGESNGIPIKDRGEYLQDQLTGSLGNLISKASGKELYNPTLGRTDSNNNPSDQGGNAVHQILDYLSGLKFTNYNGPAAERSVKGENNAAKLLAKQNSRR